MAVVAGLSEQRLAKIAGGLEAFAGEMFDGALVRSEQRKWGGAYLRGLMLDGRRESIEPMAARLADGDEQGLQQFVNQSPWDERVVRANLARRMVAEIAPEMWVIDDTGFVKKGRFSVGVGRQYSGRLGRVDNCQVGVSINAATDQASCPLDWRIFLPEAWDDDRERRAKAHLPGDVVHREKWRLALDMLDELAEWGLVPPSVGTDAGYGDITEFRQGLDERRIGLCRAGQEDDLGPPRARHAPAARLRRHGRPPTARYRAAPCSLKELVLAAGKRAARGATWREGSRGRMHSRFVALRVKPANTKLVAAAHADDRELDVRWPLAEWPSGADAPTDYWLSSLPADTDLKTLVQLAKLRWRIEHDYRELKHGLGLDHFEGRSYRGWHHHVTLVSVAHAFLTLERQRPRTRAAA